MDDVISLSSGSDIEQEDPDIEFIGVYSDTANKPDAKPFRKWMSVAKYTPFVIDLTDPRWAIAPPKRRRRRDPSSPLEVVDLVNSDVAQERHQGSKSMLLKDGKSCEALSDEAQPSLNHSPKGQHLVKDQVAQDADFLEPNPGFSSHSVSVASDQENILKGTEGQILPILTKSSLFELPNRYPNSSIFLDSLSQEYNQRSGCHDLSDNSSDGPKKAKTGSSVLIHEPCINPVREDPPQIDSTQFQPKSLQLENRVEAWSLQSLQDDTFSVSLQSPFNCADKGQTHTYLNNPFSCKTDQDDLYSPTLSPYEVSGPPSPPSDSGTEPLPWKHIESFNSPLSKLCSPLVSSSGSDIKAPQCSHTLPLPALSSGSPCHSVKNKPDRTPSPISTNTVARESPEWQTDETDLGINSPLHGCNSIPSDPPLSFASAENMDTGSEPRSPGTHRAGLFGQWQEVSDGEDVDAERTTEMDFRSASQEERRYVCPIALKTLRPLMAGPIQGLEGEEEEDSGFGAPEELCRQSLSLVYSTIEENYPEGTLQLLSDLLHPRFYPPRDITCHLLRNILLDHQSPHFLCLEAYHLLMRTQSHHIADRTTLPWDWNLLSFVMFEQNCARKHRSEVVRLLWEYVLQTLEDDFRSKLSMSALSHSIAKDTVSCETRYSQVRDVINWLFAAIAKYSGNGETTAENGEKDEHLRIVVILQKMLVLALEVDRSPTLSSAKLAQELFHNLLYTVPLRQHRLVLLETLESSLLRCKLVEHLLDHACPLRISLPMSRCLLLHFLRNCTLTPDPMDGEEGWKKWEELIQLLWMLLLSYDEVRKGHLRCSVTERANYSRPPVQTVHDVVSRSVVRESVEAFLARSQEDLGQALPPHIDESLSYLQDHLMDSCPS